MSTDPLPPEAEDLSAAAKHILEHLRKPYVNERSQQELVEKLYYNRVTVTRATDQLEGYGLIEIESCPTDARSSVYRAVEPEQ